MAILPYNFIKIPTSPSDTLNEGTETIGGILIDNDKILSDEIQALKRFWWREEGLLDGTTFVRHRKSLYNADPVCNPILVEDESWRVGCEARIGMTFAENASLQYPGSWKWIGDDCQEGNFIFEQGKSYWLFIEKRQDFTWVTVTKCP